MQQIRGYTNRRSILLCLSIGLLRLSTEPCRQTLHGCQQVFLKSRVSCILVLSVVGRLIGPLTTFDLWAVSKLDSEFISDLNLKF